MRKFDLISGIFLLALSSAICIGSLQLHVGTLTGPGSGFFPLMTGLVLGVFSILILVQARKAPGQAAPFWAARANRKGIYLAVLFIFVYAMLLERIGFVGSTILFFVLISRFVSGHRWTTAIFFALVTTSATYFVFSILIRAPLPQGIVGRIF